MIYTMKIATKNSFRTKNQPGRKEVEQIKTTFKKQIFSYLYGQDVDQCSLDELIEPISEQNPSVETVIRIMVELFW